MEIVDPVVLWVLTVPPRTGRQLARAALFHGRRCELEVFWPSRLPPRARQQGGSQHVGVVHRVLAEIVIADARSTTRGLAWMREEPSTRAFRYLKEARISKQVKRVEERLADERSPDDDRLVLRVMPATARVVEVIGPRVLPELRRLVPVEPL